MRLRYLPRAFADREAILEYLDQRSSQGARTVKRAIVHSIRLLADFPLLGTETPESGVFEHAVPRYPYKVYYRIEGQEVWIVHIRHTHREPPQS